MKFCFLALFLFSVHDVWADTQEVPGVSTVGVFNQEDFSDTLIPDLDMIYEGNHRAKYISQNLRNVFDNFRTQKRLFSRLTDIDLELLGQVVIGDLDRGGHVAGPVPVPGVESTSAPNTWERTPLNEYKDKNVMPKKPDPLASVVKDNDSHPKDVQQYFTTTTSSRKNTVGDEKTRKSGLNKDGEDLKPSNLLTKTNPKVSCEHLSGYFDHRWLKMVVSCPTNWRNITVKKQCRNWNHLPITEDMDKIAMLPVQDGSGIVYGNAFCAVCNDAQPVYAWKAALDCDLSDKTIPIKSIIDEVADLSFLHRPADTIHCTTQIIPAFPQTIESCQPRPGKLFSYSRAFRPQIHAKKNSPVSFTILLNFDFTGQTHLLFSAGEEVIQTEYVKTPRCEEGETFDTYSHRCRPVRCTAHYRLEGNNCVPDKGYYSTHHGHTQGFNPLNSPYFEEMVAISLYVNISAEEYDTMESLPNLDDIISIQIAGQLNISSDRLKDMNVSFSFDSVNRTDFEIHHIRVDSKNKIYTHSPGSTDNGEVNNIPSQQYDSESHETYTGTGTMDDQGHSLGKSDEGFESRYTAIPDSTSPLKSSTPNKEEQWMTQMDAQGSDSTVNSVQWGNLDFQRKESSIDVEPGNQTLPVIAMHISFILVPSKDPQSYESRSNTIVDKIGDMVTQNQFVLLVNGKQLIVSQVFNLDEDKMSTAHLCPWGLMMFLDDKEFEFVEKNKTEYLFVPATGSYFETGRFAFYTMLTGKKNATSTYLTYLKQYAFVCVMPRIIHADCLRIDLTPQEYQITDETRVLNFEEKEYNMTMYRVLNESTGLIEICVPPSYENFKEHARPHVLFVKHTCSSGHMFHDAEVYLTNILGRLSTIGLVLVLVTYCLFPTLRNLPGCNIMNLTLALLVAELVFVEGAAVENHALCTAVSIILHFFFLVAHFWMNVLSYDVYRTFAKRSLNGKDGNKSLNYYFPRYFAYAWGVPFIIVGVCVFLEFLKVFDLRIGYKKEGSPDHVFFSNRPNSSDFYGPDGSERSNTVTNAKTTANVTSTKISHWHSPTNACWIENPITSFSAFGAPILAIFFANCVFFIKTILTVSRTVKLTRQTVNRQGSTSSAGSTTPKSEVMLYLRMSTVMGFTWVFGFSSALISSVTRHVTQTICTVVMVHNILFVIFNVSQGIFIFVAFICNRRVLHLYARLLHRMMRKISRKAQRSHIYSVSSMLKEQNQDLRRVP